MSDHKQINVFGVTINKEFHHVARANKWLTKEGWWILASRRDKAIAAFPSESVLDRWWYLFQNSLGRVAKHVTFKSTKQMPAHLSSVFLSGLPKAAFWEPPPEVNFWGLPPAVNADATNDSPATSFNDPMKPQSDKYDLPEFDFE